MIQLMDLISSQAPKHVISSVIIKKKHNYELIFHLHTVGTSVLHVVRLRFRYCNDSAGIDWPDEPKEHYFTD